MADFPVHSDASITYNGADWATVHGASLGNLQTTNGFVYARWVSPEYGIGRHFLTLDTSELPVDATIISASLFVYGEAKGGTRPHSYRLYNSSHTDDIVAGDYDQGGTTPQSDGTIAQADFAVGSYNEFALNAAGLASIVKAGYTKFAVRESTKDVANVAPTVSNNTYIDIQVDTEANPPYLAIVYTSGLSGVKRFMLVSAAGIKKIAGVPVGSIKKLCGVS